MFVEPHLGIFFGIEPRKHEKFKKTALCGKMPLPLLIVRCGRGFQPRYFFVFLYFRDFVVKIERRNIPNEFKGNY
jgi:hypothetical protein